MSTCSLGTLADQPPAVRLTLRLALSWVLVTDWRRKDGWTYASALLASSTTSRKMVTSRLTFRRMNACLKGSISQLNRWTTSKSGPRSRFAAEFWIKSRAKRGASDPEQIVATLSRIGCSGRDESKFLVRCTISTNISSGEERAGRWRASWASRLPPARADTRPVNSMLN